MTYGDDAFRLLDGGGGRGRRGHLVKFHYLVPMQCSLPLLNGVDFYYMGQELRESRVALHLAARACLFHAIPPQKCSPLSMTLVNEKITQYDNLWTPVLRCV